jgi:hypothetical protein
METYIVKKEEDKLFLYNGNDKIGQVSPNAIWVKEGNKFNEGDIEYGGWRDEELTLITVKIKCPTCKTFH